MKYTNKENQLMPNVKMPLMINGEWGEFNSHTDLKGKKVVIFALPGAMTPTCSNNHLPKYDELYSVFKDNGIDEIYCLSVNDTFVMNSWAKELNVKNVKMLPDGNGDFTKLMGMIANKRDLGFGDRTWRYSMLINDLKIEKMFIEEDRDGDPFDVSDAVTMLNYINPNADLPKSVTILTRDGCPFCAKAKNYLSENGYSFSEIRVNNQQLYSISGRDSYPQIFIDGINIGGYDALVGEEQKECAECSI